MSTYGHKIVHRMRVHIDVLDDTDISLPRCRPLLPLFHVASDIATLSKRLGAQKEREYSRDGKRRRSVLVKAVPQQ